MIEARTASRPGAGTGFGAALPTMREDQFSRWVALLEKRTGIVVPETRREFLVTSLRARMRETGHQSFDSYYEELQSGPKGAIEWATLVDRLTVHQTHFFRHQPSLDYIGSTWLRALVVRGDWDGSVHAWSLGCATGEEAYSLAMVLDAGLKRLGRRALFGVNATDVSQPALNVGRAGIYPRSRLKEIPAELAAEYTRPLDGEQFEIVENLRKRVGFSIFNLLDLARAPLKRLDLIYCQNVLIYFARERRAELLAALAELLKPGGLLLLGPGEVLNFTHPRLERVPARNLLAYLGRD